MSEYKSLVLHRKSNYVIVEMNHGKVNAINTVLCDDIIAAFREIQEDEMIQGAILSGRPHCFSAGLDVMSLATSGVEGARTFWASYHEMLRVLIHFPKPLVAAVTGFAPAAGTILALCADYRVMGKGDKHVMGMNEFNMSLQIPAVMGDIFAYYIGEANAWAAVQTVKMYHSDEALQVGLVNESVEVEEVMGRAEARLTHAMDIIPEIYRDTKNNFRKGLIKIIDQDMEPVLDTIIENFKSPSTQKMVAFFMEALKNK